MTESRAIIPSSIVLVDDEPSILTCFRILLASSGMSRIVTFNDSRDLLPFLAGNTVDVVVLDLQMPYISGKELLQEIVCRFPHISVIIMTAAFAYRLACVSIAAFGPPVVPDV